MRSRWASTCSPTPPPTSLARITAALLCVLVAASSHAGTLRGRVAQENGYPVPGAMVYAPTSGSPLRVINNQIMTITDTPRAITGADGQFSVDAGHAVANQLFVLDMMNQPALVRVAAADHTEIVLPTPSSLTLWYQKGPDAVAGQEFTAHLLDGGQTLRYSATAKTDAQGRIAFQDLLPGAYLIEASEPVPPVGCCFRSVVVQRREVRLEEGQAETVRFGGTDLPCITGSFTDGEGDPLHGVWARLAPKNPVDDAVWSAVTGRDGAYTIYDVPPGEYELRYFRRLALNDSSRVLQGSREVVVTADAPAHAGTGLPENRIDVTVDLAPFLPLPIGGPAPDFEAPLLDGGTFRLANHRGKVVVLYVYSTWCAGCVQSIPDFEKSARVFADTPAVFVGVSLDQTQAELQEFAREQRLRQPQAWAGPWETSPLRTGYRVASVPSSFIIAPDGTLAHRDLFGDYLEQEVRKLQGQ